MSWQDQDEGHTAGGSNSVRVHRHRVQRDGRTYALVVGADREATEKRLWEAQHLRRPGYEAPVAAVR